jgi:hypothetical protein
MMIALFPFVYIQAIKITAYCRKQFWDLAEYGCLKFLAITI